MTLVIRWRHPFCYSNLAGVDFDRQRFDSAFVDIVLELWVEVSLNIWMFHIEQLMSLYAVCIFLWNVYELVWMQRLYRIVFPCIMLYMWNVYYSTPYQTNLYECAQWDAICPFYETYLLFCYAHLTSHLLNKSKLKQCIFNYIDDSKKYASCK